MTRRHPELKRTSPPFPFTTLFRSVSATARVADEVGIGPHCVLEDGARIGRGARLGAGCVVGAHSVVGEQCLLYARVTLYHGVTLGDRVIVHSGAVLGADGFGFAPDPRVQDGGWAKIAQLGGVSVGNDVEIGANTTIARGANDNTVIGDRKSGGEGTGGSVRVVLVG